MLIGLLICPFAINDIEFGVSTVSIKKLPKKLLPSFCVTRTGVPGRSPCGFGETIVILEGVA